MSTPKHPTASTPIADYPASPDPPFTYLSPVPSSDQVRQGTLCHRQPILRWAPDTADFSKRAAVAHSWPVLQQPVQLESNYAFYNCRITTFTRKHLTLQCLSDPFDILVEWSDLLAIHTLKPET